MNVTVDCGELEILCEEAGFSDKPAMCSGRVGPCGRLFDDGNARESDARELRRYAGNVPPAQWRYSRESRPSRGLGLP